MYFPQCLTYFRVHYGNKPFDMKDFCERLGLDYEYAKDYGTDVTLHIGENYCFDVDINVMLRKSLKDLFGKEEILAELRREYCLEYYIERVPTIVANSEIPNQLFSLDADIIEFMYKTGAHDDFDYFVLANPEPAEDED